MNHTNSLPALLAVVLLLGGCAAPPPPPEPAPVPDLRIGNLVYRQDGFMDARTGWIYPQGLLGHLTATQAWDQDETLIGIAYTQAAPGAQLALAPAPVSLELAEAGTVTLLTYPAGHQASVGEAIPGAGNLPHILGLGHGQQDSLDEFWAYQRALEENKYNLWKLVKLADASAPERVFHSLLVLRKLNEQRSDGLVVTVGRVGDVHTLIVIRKFVRTREEVDQFGDWAYAVLREFGLATVKE